MLLPCGHGCRQRRLGFADIGAVGTCRLETTAVRAVVLARRHLDGRPPCLDLADLHASAAASLVFLQVKAVVTTAEGLTREESEAIQRGLQPLLKPGQKLTLEEEVGPGSGEMPACAAQRRE